MAHNSINICQAQSFMAALDPAADAFCFRTFADQGADSQLCRKTTASFTKAAPLLAAINQQGAGVFVVINDGGQTKGEITRIRAVFADTDGAPLEPILAAGLKPHIIVESSPGKWHVYWLVVSDFPLDMFGPAQTAIAKKFGTDQAVKDLPRVMRLPGFLHQKAEPFMTRIVEINPDLPRYTLKEIIAGLNLQLGHKAANADPLGEMPKYLRHAFNGIGNTGATMTLAEAETTLRYINPDCDRHRWWNILAALAHEFGTEAEDLARRWSMGLLWKRGAS